VRLRTTAPNVYPASKPAKVVLKDQGRIQELVFSNNTIAWRSQASSDPRAACSQPHWDQGRARWPPKSPN